MAPNFVEATPDAALEYLTSSPAKRRRTAPYPWF